MPTARRSARRIFEDARSRHTNAADEMLQHLRHEAQAGPDHFTMTIPEILKELRGSEFEMESACLVRAFINHPLQDLGVALPTCAILQKAFYLNVSAADVITKSATDLRRAGLGPLQLRRFLLLLINTGILPSINSDKTLEAIGWLHSTLPIEDVALVEFRRQMRKRTSH